MGLKRTWHNEELMNRLALNKGKIKSETLGSVILLANSFVRHKFKERDCVSFIFLAQGLAHRIDSNKYLLTTRQTQTDRLTD